MRLLISTGAAALSLLVSGCGDKDADGNLSAAANTAPIAAIPAPNGGDWTQMVAETPEGGFRMGNPAAPVKIIEFGSLTCSHCADFSKEGLPILTQKYIKAGQASYELRNFVRDPLDIGAALLSRCGGATPYFQLTEQIFAAQEDWFAKVQTMSQADQQRLETMTPEQRTGTLARQAGLVDFARLRGIPAEKSEACLADKGQLERLVAINEAATSQYKVDATPTFLINGEVVPNAADWRTLEPAIRAALN